MLKQFPLSNSFLSSNENIFLDAWFFQDGRIFTRSSEAIYIWAPDGYLIRKIDKITDAANGIKGTVFLSDENFVSWEWDGDNEFYLWNSDGTLIHKMTGFSKAVDNVLTLSDNRFLSIHYDSKLRIWNSEGKLLKIADTPNPFLDEISLTPDGKIIACGHNIVRIYNSNGDVLINYTGHQTSALKARMRFDGNYVSWSNKQAHIWNSDGILLGKIALGSKKRYKEIVVREDGTMLSWSEYSNMITLWNSDGTKYRELKQHSRFIEKVIVLDKGKYISVDQGGHLFLWEDEHLIWKCINDHSVDWITDFQVIGSERPVFLIADRTGYIRFTDFTGKAIHQFYHGASDYGGPIVSRNDRQEYLVRAGHVCQFNSECIRQFYFGTHANEEHLLDSQMEISVMVFKEGNFFKGYGYNQNGAITWEYNTETKRNYRKKAKAETDALKVVRRFESTLKRLKKQHESPLFLFVTVRSPWGVEIMREFQSDTLIGIKGLQFLSSDIFNSLLPILPEMDLDLLQLSFLNDSSSMPYFYGIHAKRLLFYHCNNINKVSGSRCNIERVEVFGTEKIEGIDISGPMGESPVEFTMDMNSLKLRRRK